MDNKEIKSKDTETSDKVHITFREEYQLGDIVQTSTGKVKLVEKCGVQNMDDGTVSYEWVVEEVDEAKPCFISDLFEDPVESTCPNCGWDVPLMSHGICHDCEYERKMDKYVYCS